MVSAMTSSPVNPPPVLLEVRNVREEIRAGLGQTSLSVRTLDGVTLAVHAGELVVLRGGVASGAPSLLAALAGVRRARSGHRRLARGVQIRRACISDAAFAAIAAVWAQPVAERGNALAFSARPRVVYIFRVRSPERGHQIAAPGHISRGGTVVDASVWGVWAESLRAGGGSIVAHVTNDRAHATWQRYPHADRVPKRTSPAVHEATAGDRRSYQTRGEASNVLPRHHPTGRVRMITLAAGRIVSAGPVTHPTWSDRSGDS
jgi:energy-coupling factor transporter ATP-binding protein EcfA2